MNNPNGQLCTCGHALLFHDTRADEPCTECDCRRFILLPNTCPECHSADARKATAYWQCNTCGNEWQCREDAVQMAIDEYGEVGVVLDPDDVREALS